MHLSKKWPFQAIAATRHAKPRYDSVRNNAPIHVRHRKCSPHPGWYMRDPGGGHTPESSRTCRIGSATINKDPVQPIMQGPARMNRGPFLRLDARPKKIH